MGKALTLSKSIYSTWDDSVMSYLNSIRKFEVMTPDEEIATLDKAKNGTEEEKIQARRKIMECNQRFVYAVAKEYAKGNDIMDIVQEATVGMEKAIDRFDPTIGTKFLSFAVWYMRRQILSYITNDASLVRSSNKQKLMGVLPRVKEKFFQENHREPTPEETIELLEKEHGIKIKENEDTYDLVTTSISDTMVGDEETPSPFKVEFDVSTASSNEYENEIENEWNSYLVDKLLSVCTEKEREMMKMMYGIGYDEPVPIEDVAEKFNMTKTRALQLKKNIIKKIQKAVPQMR